MPRLYHSPSSIELGRECQRKWAYRYIAGIREPEPSWATYEHGLPKSCGHDPRLAPYGVCRACSKLQSKALGTALHSIGEARYRGLPSPYVTGFPAEVWASGAWMLPHPDECGSVEVEAQIGGEPLVGSSTFDRGMRVGRVLIVGKRDLTVDGVRLFDYKTTKSIAKYGNTPDVLLDDLQCNTYALDIARRTGQATVQCRWAYFQTDPDRRGAAPSDITIERSRAEDVVGEAAEFAAMQLDTLEHVEDAPCNVLVCGEYGGCEHHTSVGGPCDARRSIGALIMTTARISRSPKKGRLRSMAISAEQKARWASMGGATASAEPEATPATATEAAPAATEAAPAATEAAPIARRPRGRPAAAAAPAATEATPAVAQPNALGAIQALVAERDAAVARVSEIENQLGALRDVLTNALGVSA